MVQTVQRLTDRLPLHYQRSNYQTADDGEQSDTTDRPKFYWLLSPWMIEDKAVVERHPKLAAFARLVSWNNVSRMQYQLKVGTHVQVNQLNVKLSPFFCAIRLRFQTFSFKIRNVAYTIFGGQLEREKVVCEHEVL
jgi:hypothetical protein